MRKILWLLICFISLCAHSSPEQGRLVLKIDIQLTLNALPSMNHINELSISLLQAVLNIVRSVIESHRLSLAESFFESPRPRAGYVRELTLVQIVRLTPPQDLIGDQIPLLLHLHTSETIAINFEMALPILVTMAHSGYGPTINIPFFDSQQSISIPLEQISPLSDQLVTAFYPILNAHIFPLAVIAIYFLLALMNQAS